MLRILSGLVLPKAFASFFNYFTTDLGRDAFVLPIPTWQIIHFVVKFISEFVLKWTLFTQRFPFDWKNPIGYSVAVAQQLHIVLLSLQYINTFFCLEFGGLLFTFSLVKDIKGDLHRFNRVAKNKKSQSKIACMKQLAQLIRFHADIKELSLWKFIVGTNM